MRHVYLLFLCIFSSTLFAQNLKVSEELLANLETVVRYTETDTFTFRVALPKNYDSEKAYPLLLGLSGGEQTQEIVDYCYAAYFESGYFIDYIVIMPVNTTERNLADYSPETINSLLNEVNEAYNTTGKWLLSGTSDGGTAAYNFVAANPTKFEALFVAPGNMRPDIVVTSEWSHLKVVIAYGALDDKKWIIASKEAAKRIKKNVDKMTLLGLADQGHILAISFNIDRLYDIYFIDFKKK